MPSITPLIPPIVKVTMKASANSIAVERMWSFDANSVPSQETGNHTTCLEPQLVQLQMGTRS